MKVNVLNENTGEVISNNVDMNSLENIMMYVEMLRNTMDLSDGQTKTLIETLVSSGSIDLNTLTEMGEA